MNSNYKRILENELVQESIICECMDDICQIQALENLSVLHHKTHRPLKHTVHNDQFHHAMGIFPNISFFKPLYQASTYFSENQWNDFITDPDLMDNCFEILNRYADWWLEGGSRNPEEDTSLFDFVFRSLYFSINYIGKSTQHTEILEKIITLLPANVCFDGLDLWLERKASQLYYRRWGIAFFEASARNLRAPLLSYLVAKLDITGDEREKFAELVQYSKGYNYDDVYSKYIRDPGSVKWFDLRNFYD